MAEGHGRMAGTGESACDDCRSKNERTGEAAPENDSRDAAGLESEHFVLNCGARGILLMEEDIVSRKISGHFWRVAWLLSAMATGSLEASDYNALVLERLEAMPQAGTYAKYHGERPESSRFDDLYATVKGLSKALQVERNGALRVKLQPASRYSFCSSATYLLFCDVIAELQKQGKIASVFELNRELVDVGDYRDVIAGKLDGVGIFGQWNADGPGTAVLFKRLGLGRNFLGYEHAKPGDFLKIFWNSSIGAGERGHLVVYLGESEKGNAIRVWSSNTQNDDGSSGYGTMWIEKSRIERALFTRLESPENLEKWLRFGPEEKSSDYLIRIRSTGSSVEELIQVTGAIR